MDLNFWLGIATSPSESPPDHVANQSEHVALTVAFQSRGIDAHEWGCGWGWQLPILANALIYIDFLGNTGAPELTNIEPENVQEIFAELEDWGHILGADPLISRKLKEFEAVASRKTSTQQKQTSRKVSRPVRGPSL